MWVFFSAVMMLVLGTLFGFFGYDFLRKNKPDTLTSILEFADAARGRMFT